MHPTITFQTTSQLGSIRDFIQGRQTDYSKILVIFDMDLTLTMPPLPVLAYLTLPSYRKKLQQILSAYSEKDQRSVMTMGLQVSQQNLVDATAPTLIKELQATGIKTIVLTASLTGQLNDTTPIELQRFEKLKSLGILLEQSFPDQEIVLHNLPYTQNTDVLYPIYYHGILCVNGQPGTNTKGPALVAWLEHIQYMPNTVIMIDDKKQHLIDVYQSLSHIAPSIEFIGLEYLQATQHLSNYIDDTSFVTYWQDLVSNVSPYPISNYP